MPQTPVPLVEPLAPVTDLFPEILVTATAPAAHLLVSDSSEDDSGSTDDDRQSSCSSSHEDTQAVMSGMDVCPRPRLRMAYAKSDTDMAETISQKRTELDGYTTSRGYSSVVHRRLDRTSIASPHHPSRVNIKNMLLRAQEMLGAELSAKTSWRTTHRDPTVLMSRSQDSGVLFYDEEDVQYRRKSEPVLIAYQQRQGKASIPLATPERPYGPASGSRIRGDRRKETHPSLPLQMSLRSRGLRSREPG